MNFTFEIHSPKHGTFAVTAPERFRKEIEEHTWSVHRDTHRAMGRQFDVRTHIRGKNGGRDTLLLHQLIWELIGNPPSSQIDHHDGQPLNNAEINLRAARPCDNSRNRRKQSNNTSGTIGVNWVDRCNKWRSQIRVNGKRKHLGYFATIEEAAAARDAGALKYHGEFAVLNEEAN